MDDSQNLLRPFADISKKGNYAKQIATLMVGALRSFGDVEYKIERRVLVEVLECYAKDIRRVSEHQGQEIAPGAWIGYLLFWFCKLKPITCAWLSGQPEETIPDINEQVAVRMGEGMFLTSARNASKIVAGSAPDELNFTRGVLRSIYHSYVRSNYEYLVYSLRHRHLSGDALVLWLSGLFSAVDLMLKSKAKRARAD
jgi:hypothetical protein